MLGQNTTHANFSVNDLEVARKFYIEKLGFTLSKQTKGDFMIESGAGTKANIYYKPDHKAWDSTVFGIEVDDVRTMAAELGAIGIPVERIPGTDETGIITDPEMGTAAWFRDPAGNWICISSRS